ncbi:hypothetical protein CI610_00927 [invertebrate metagenome]|uniref:Uncharacterized protein n=1 Tax=invertebrate metagenome TaxID=1711999 RepID=A0A2H9TA08_9ZZZZ
MLLPETDVNRVPTRYFSLPVADLITSSLHSAHHH